MIIFLIIYLNQAKIKQETFEYRTGQFIITQGEYLHNEIFQAHDPINNNYTTPDYLNKILFQSSYKFDQIIDVQKRLQPLSTIQYQIWVFGKMKDSYYLVELSTEYTNNKIINQIYEILNPSVQCFTFNFALFEQVVFDCTDLKNDFFLVFDIKSSNQYKVYYQKYNSQIRKLHFFQDLHILLIQNDDKLYFIRQNQRSRKYFVFYKFKLDDNQLFISQKSEGENLSIIFKTFRLQFQARNFMNQYEINYILNSTRTSDNFAFKVNDDYYYVKNYCLISSSYQPFLQLDGQVYNFVEDEDILVIQTINLIYIITIENNQKRIQELSHTFSNETIIINSRKKEIYVLNSTRLFVYYYQYDNFQIISFNKSIIIEKNKSSSILIVSEQKENLYIHINKYFLFRDAENPNHVVNQIFLFSGGQIDVTFQQIDFLKINVQYLQLLSEFECKKLYLINENDYVVKKQSLFCQQDQIFYIIECNHVNNCVRQNDSITITHNPHMFIKAGNCIQYNVSESSFLIQAILGEDKAEYIIHQFNQQLTLINFEYGELIFINHLQRQIEIKNLNNLATYQQIIYIYPRMIRCGQHQGKLLVIENQIATLFVRELQYYQMIQTFDLCDDFLDFIIIDIYLVQICRTKILKYIQITDFVYQISGHLTLYGETFNINSQILNSFEKFFYIVYENEISIFNIQLPLKQAYIKKLVLEQFDQVIAIDNYLFIRRQSKVYCYKNQLSLEIQYDEDKFEYNQLVYLNVCAQNYYDKKCLNQKFQIKQTNMKINIKEKRVKVYLRDINQKITINQFFSGSVNQVTSDKFTFESRQLAYSYEKTNDPKSLYYLAFSQDYIKFHGSQNITIYDVTKNKSIQLNTNLNTKDIIKINNYLLLFGSMSQTETYDCTDFPNCSLVCSFQRGFNIFDLMNVQNNLIIIQLSSEIVVYKFDICSFRIINTFKMARSYQAYHLHGDKTQILVYIDFSDFVHYIYNGIEKIYYIQDIFKDFEQIYSFWHINRVKLIENTQIVIFITGMGSFFVQFSQSQDPQMLSQLVPFQNAFQHFFSIQIQDTTIQIIYKIDYHLIVYNFKICQIFQQKYIDYRYLQLDIGHSLQSSFGVLFIFNDHIYLTNSTFQQIQVFQVPFYYNLIIDENITENTEIQITLSNSDDQETFTIELILDDEYLKLKYVLGTVIIVLLALFFIKRQFYLRKIGINV